MVKRGSITEGKRIAKGRTKNIFYIMAKVAREI